MLFAIKFTPQYSLRLSATMERDVNRLSRQLPLITVLNGDNENPAIADGVECVRFCRGFDQEPHILPCLSQRWVLYGFQLSS